MSTGLVSLLLLEARRNPGLWLFPFVVVMVWFLTAQERAKGIWLWPDVSLSIESTLAVVGPLAAGVAAWAASRHRRYGIEELLATTPRPAASRDLAAWAATAAWFVLAYAAAAGFIQLLAYLGGAWGSPVLWPVLVGLLALGTHSAIGHATGYYLPSSFTAPIVAVVLFLLQAGPGYFAGSVRHLSPLNQGLTRSVFHGVLPNLFVGQALWLLGLAGAALVAVTLKQRISVASLSLMLATVAVGTLGASLLLEKPPWASPAQMKAAIVPYDPVCVREEILICVHPAYKEMLPETAAVVGEIAKPLVDVPGGPTRAKQSNSVFAEPERNGTLSFFLHDKRSLGDELASQVSGELVGYQTPAIFRENGGAPDDARAAIQAWLLRQAGRDSEYVVFDGRKPEAVVAASQRFEELTPEERNEWLREDYPDLRAGKLTLKDLP